MEIINKKEFKKQLEGELKLSGAMEGEIGEFSQIADKLKGVSQIERSYTLKKKFLEDPSSLEHSRVWSFLPRWSFAISLAVLILFAGFVSVAAAQKSLPGDPLYPIKRLSENIVSTVKPSFKKEILLRRREEVKNLLEEKKDSKLLQRAIDDYDKELEKQEKEASSEKEGETKKSSESPKEAEKESPKPEDEEDSNLTTPRPSTTPSNSLNNFQEESKSDEDEKEEDD